MRPNALLTLGLTVGALIAVALLASGPAAADADYSAGLQVTGEQHFEDIGIAVTGELRVVSGGSLSLEAVTLTMSPDANGIARVVVEPGAELIVLDSLVQSSAAGSPAAMQVELHGNVLIRGSTLRGIAPAAGAAAQAALPNGFIVPASGLVVTGSGVSLDHDTISSTTGCGVAVVSSSARLTAVTLERVRPAAVAGGSFAAGVCVIGGDATLDGLDLRGALVLPAGGVSRVAGVVAVGTDGLSLLGLDARGVVPPNGPQPAWSAAVLLSGASGVEIRGGEIANGENGIVALDPKGPEPFVISAMTIRVMSDTPIEVPPTAYTTSPPPFYFDNLTIDVCGAYGVSFTSDGSSAAVSFTLDNVTVSNCASAGVLLHVRSTTTSSIHTLTIVSCTATANGQEGFLIWGENVQAAVNVVIGFSTATHNGYSGFRVANAYPAGSTAIASARVEYNTAINNSEYNASTRNDGGFTIDLGSPNTLSLRYNNNTAIGNVPNPQGSGNHWGHYIQVAVRSTMVLPKPDNSPGGAMTGLVARENGGYGVVLIGGAASSSRFDIAKVQECTIRDQAVGLHAENARVEVWFSFMSNNLEFEGVVTDFIVAGTVHNRLSGTTTGVKTIQSYKFIDFNAVWQNDRPISNASLRFINGSGSTASMYSTLTPLTGATNLFTNAQGQWSGWVLDWIFDPNLPASQQNRINYAPITIAVVPGAKEARSQPFNLDENIVGPVVFNDEDPPDIIVYSPRDNGVYTTTNLNVTGIVTDDVSGVAALRVSIDGINWSDVPAVGGSFTWVYPNLGDGIYNIFLQSWDKANAGLTAPNVTNVTIGSIRIDTQPPALDLVLPALRDGDFYYTNQPVMVFQGSVDASIVNLFVNGATVVPTGSYFSYTANLTSEGPQTYVFLALDAAGNTRQITVTVIRDTFKPTLIITDPEVSGDIYVRSTFLQLRGVTDSNTNISVAGTNITVTNQTFVIPVSLTAGRNQIRISAVDAAGNTNERTITVYSDTVAPQIVVDSFTDGGWSNSTRVRVGGTVSEDVPYVTIGQYVVPVLSGIFSATIALSDGLNDVTVRATDQAGNLGTTTVTINVDTVAPTIEFLGLPDSLTVSNFRFVVRGSLSEPATVLVNGAQADITGLDFDSTVNLQEGDNVISVSAQDMAGNRIAVERHILLDTEPPAITVEQPLEGATVSDSLVKIKGTTEPYATIVVAGHYIPADADGSFEAWVLLPSTGSNGVVLDVTDSAGNHASKTINVAYQAVSQDTLGPLVTSGAIAGAIIGALGAAGFLLSRHVVARKVAAWKKAHPQEAAPPSAPRAPRPPRPPSEPGAAPPRPPRPPSN